jgi:error-prone DNA polymerase
MPELSDKQERKRQLAKVHALPLPMRKKLARMLPDYAELHCLTNFSFQRGASTPEEMVERAYQLGYEALAITDECSVAGIVRAHVALRDLPAKMDEYEREHPEEPKIPRNPDFRLLFGSEFHFERFKLVVIANDTEGWGNLCEFITAARTTELPKGEYRVSWEGSGVASLQRCQVLFVPNRNPGGAVDTATLHEDLAAAKALYADNLWLAVELLNELDDDLWLVTLMQRAASHRRCRWWRPATCACTRARASHCRTCSRPCAKARPWPNAASRCSRMPSATCARACGWPSCTWPTC